MSLSCQVCWPAVITHLRIYSRVQWTRSVCPSDSGWNAVEGCKEVFQASSNPFQKLDRNLGSLSQTILLGRPCYLTTTATKAWAKVLAVVSDCKGMKWACFENLSTTVRILQYPLLTGKSTIRSMEISTHGRSGIGKGFKSPPGA